MKNEKTFTLEEIPHLWPIKDNTVRDAVNKKQVEFAYELRPVTMQRRVRVMKYKDIVKRWGQPRKRK